MKQETSKLNILQSIVAFLDTKIWTPLINKLDPLHGLDDLINKI